MAESTHGESVGQHDHSRRGQGGDTVAPATIDGAVTGDTDITDLLGVLLAINSGALDVDPGDGEELLWGADDDISERFDATADDLVWQDNTAGTDRMAMDRTSGNLIVGGTVDETTSP